MEKPVLIDKTQKTLFGIQLPMSIENWVKIIEDSASEKYDKRFYELTEKPMRRELSIDLPKPPESFEKIKHHNSQYNNTGYIKNYARKPTFEELTKDIERLVCYATDLRLYLYMRESLPENKVPRYHDVVNVNVGDNILILISENKDGCSSYKHPISIGVVWERVLGRPAHDEVYQRG